MPSHNPVGATRLKLIVPYYYCARTRNAPALITSWGYGGHATRLHGAHNYNLTFSKILCAQKRVVRGTYLGVSCIQTTPPPDATLPDSTAVNSYKPILLNNIVHSRTRSARDAFRSFLHSTYHRLRGGYGGTAIPDRIMLKNEQFE